MQAKKVVAGLLVLASFEAMEEAIASLKDSRTIAEELVPFVASSCFEKLSIERGEVLGSDGEGVLVCYNEDRDLEYSKESRHILCFVAFAEVSSSSNLAELELVRSVERLALPLEQLVVVLAIEELE